MKPAFYTYSTLRSFKCQIIVSGSARLPAEEEHGCSLKENSWWVHIFKKLTDRVSKVLGYKLTLASSSLVHSHTPLIMCSVSRLTQPFHFFFVPQTNRCLHFNSSVFSPDIVLISPDLCHLMSSCIWVLCLARGSILCHRHQESQLGCLAVAPLYLCSCLCLCVCFCVS